MEGKCIILCAPSGSGKTSITKFLLSQKLGLAFSISACTREKRAEEIDGVDYYFLKSQDIHGIESGNEFIDAKLGNPNIFTPAF